MFSAPDNIRFLQHSIIYPKDYRLIDAIELDDHIKNENQSKHKLIDDENYSEQESDDEAALSDECYSYSQPLTTCDGRCLLVKVYAKPTIIRHLTDQECEKANKFSFSVHV
jgi:hypothetical protein